MSNNRGFTPIVKPANNSAAGVRASKVESIPGIMANPAAEYCNFMNTQFGNYKYVIKKDKNGGQYGVCITPDKKEVDEWKFFSGQDGVKYSYCARKGYASKVVDGSYSSKELACVISSSLITKDKILSSKIKNLKKEGNNYLVPVSKLIEKNSTLTVSAVSSALVASAVSNASNYSYWDWRNPPNGTIYAKENFAFFDDANGWVTPVKNQGSCGACYAFAAVGLMESKYEINNLNSELNPDLSEEDDAINNGGCDGGFLQTTIDFGARSGIVDENCLPFNSSQSSNSSYCKNSSSRKWYNDFSNVYSVDKSLIVKGPIAAAMGIGGGVGGYFDSQGIYRCSAAGINHAVLVVGYNDTGQYWIVKNSWGSLFGDNGYFKLGYGECTLSSWLGITTVNSPNFAPEFLNLKIPINYFNESQNVSVNFTILNNLENNSAVCKLNVNNLQIEEKNNIKNNTLVNFNIFFNNSQSYNWNIDCWENNLGIVKTIFSNIESNLNLNNCRTLNVPNVVYTLQNNITTTGTCFTLAADNITLDGNGYSITGDGSFGSGIEAQGRINITIQNFLHIQKFGYVGIDFTFTTDNSIIKNVIVNNNSNIGIYIVGSNNSIINVTSYSNGGGGPGSSGIFINSGFNNILENIQTYGNIF